MHAARWVTHTHRAEGVSVVAALDGEHLMTLGSADAALILQCHLQRHLDTDRARVSQEDMLQWLWGEVDQGAAQGDRWLVGEPAKHHVGELIGPQGLVEGGYVVPVDCRPPRAHAINDLLAVDGQPDPAGRSDYAGRHRIGHRSVGMPKVLPIEVQAGHQALGATAVPAPRRRIAGSWELSSPSTGASTSAPSTTKPLSRINSRSASAAWPSEVR